MESEPTQEQLFNPGDSHDHLVARMLMLGEISIEEAFGREQDSFERSLGERPELPDFTD
jgi:hypothetical protein